MSVKHVRKWRRELKEGRTDVHGEQLPGRSSVSDETIANVEEAILKDRRVAVRELSEMTSDVSRTSIGKIVYKSFRMWQGLCEWEAEKTGYLGGAAGEFGRKEDGTCKNVSISTAIM